MRLFFIDKPECRHISEIVKGVSAVYQMEQEFYPYLVVEFLPNPNGELGGIILQAGDEIIRKNYTFENEKDIDELRNLVWSYLKKYHHIKNLPDNGKFDWKPTNVVLQGWQEKKRNLKRDICCKIVREAVVKAMIDQKILHWVYRDPTTPHIDRNRCKQLRWEECGSNYPPDSQLFQRCLEEVNWLCNQGYPPKGEKLSPITQIQNIDKLRKKIWQDLDKYNLKVNKQKFDEIISAGLFDDVGNRMGNQSNNLMNLRDTVDRVMWEKDYYSQILEGFDGDSKIEGFNINVTNYLLQSKPTVGLILILLLVLVVLVWWINWF